MCYLSPGEKSLTLVGNYAESSSRCDSLLRFDQFAFYAYRSRGNETFHFFFLFVYAKKKRKTKKFTSALSLRKAKPKQ